MDPKQSIAIVYQNSAIDFVNEKNQHRVKCLRPVKKDTILFIEQIFSETKETSPNRMTQLIRCSSYLQNSLAPRENTWSEEMISGEFTREAKKHIFDKVQANAFGDGNIFLLGDKISWFNHSETPNIVSQYSWFETGLPIDAHFQTFLALRDIEVGEELCFCQNENIEFKSSKASIKSESNQNVAEPYKMSPMTEALHNSLLEKQSHSSTFKSVLINHLCIMEGLQYTEDIICPTPRFMSFLEKQGISTDEIDPKEACMKQIEFLDKHLER